MADLHFFPMYASDWLAGEATTLMTCEQEGAFLRLLCHAWLSKDEIPCSIPADDKALSELSKLRKRWGRVGGFVKEQFVEVEGRPDRLRNPRLWQVYEEQVEKHSKRVASGSKGGKAKAQRKQKSSNARAMLQQSSSNALAKGYQSESEPELETTNNLSAARNWTVDAAEVWAKSVAPIPVGRVGGTLKTAVHSHGWEKVRLGMEAYILGTPDGRWNLQAFSNAVNHWISLGEECPRTASGELSMTDREGKWTRLGKIVNENQRRSA
jgi:uncharacterized protein YdaU (DUF1376 family)